MPPVPLGFVGAGNFAHTLAETAAADASIRIAACYDPSDSARASFTDRFGCTSHQDLASLCADPTILGAVVATPNDLHHDHVVALARAGKHVFVEKPIALTLSEADRMIAACRDHGVILAVGHQERRRPIFRQIKRMIDSGELGVIRGFEANHCGNLVDAWPEDDWRFDPARGSGPLLHKGIHKLDILHYCFGPAMAVTTMAVPLPFSPAMHQTTVSAIRYANDVIGSFTSGFRHNNASLAIYGQLRSVFTDGYSTSLRIKDERNWKWTELDCGRSDPIAEELAEFAAAITGSGPVEVDGEEAREALLVALAAQEAQGGHSIRIDAMRRAALVPRPPTMAKRA